MMAWLLDTNILSEIRRLKPEPKVLTFIAARPLLSFGSASSGWTQATAAKN
jgi:toxin FitB